MDSTSKKSRLRLRIGIFFIFLWWLPFWLIAPFLSDVFGLTTAQAQHRMFVAVILVQTVVGVTGVVIAGRLVMSQMRHVPYRKFPKTIWNILKTGNADGLAEPSK